MCRVDMYDTYYTYYSLRSHICFYKPFCIWCYFSALCDNVHTPAKGNFLICHYISMKWNLVTSHCECQNLVQSIEFSGVINEGILMIFKCIYLTLHICCMFIRWLKMYYWSLTMQSVIIYALFYMQIFMSPFLYVNVHRLWP